MSAPRSRPPRTTAFADAEVAAHFKAYPATALARMLALREFIFSTAAKTRGVGELQEMLKWGEPAYVTAATRSGSTLRIDWKPKRPDHYAVYFNCQTDLVETFRTMFPNDFQFEGNRALVLKLADEVPWDALAICIEATLTYHDRKRASGRRISGER